MKKHTPQEIANFFDCYVAEDKNHKWHMFPSKAPSISSDFPEEWRTLPYDAILINKALLEIPYYHKWTDLYIPEKENCDIQYSIASAQNPVALERVVSAYIRQGYIPLGGVSVGPEGLMYQAVVKGNEKT